MTHPILSALGLADTNSGTFLGNDEWSKTTDAGVLEPLNPATNEPLAKVYATSDADYETIVRNAQKAFAEWRNVPAPKRGEAVRLCARALREHKDALGSLVALEMGKIKPEGDGEVQEMIDIADFAVGQSRMLYGLSMHSERPGHRMYEQWHPLGLVGIISAFNFPVAVWSWNAFIAAVCGNVCIWKPSPKTPLSAIAAVRICNEALKAGGFPEIFYLFNDAGSELAQKFVDDKRIPLISFTGSTKVGRMVGERVAARMGRSLLELGGNNAIIVDETAELKLAIPAIVFGAVGTAGQRCTTTRRLFVHESIYADVLAEAERVAAAAARRETLDHQRLADMGLGDHKIVDVEVVIVLGVGDRRFQALAHVFGDALARELQVGERARDLLAADHLRDQVQLSSRAADGVADGERFLVAHLAGCSLLAHQRLPFLSEAWPWNVRVGANSPSFMPTMSSLTDTGTNLRPL